MCVTFTVGITFSVVDSHQDPFTKTRNISNLYLSYFVKHSSRVPGGKPVDRF